MARLEQLSDTQMVRVQRSAMTDPGAPNPSVEAVLHAVIPFVYVDHTHADAVVAITNTEEGEARVRDIYGGRVLVIPYVMPGFILAQKVYAMTRSLNWKNYDVMVLMSHGVFTFHDDAKACYERMIKVVSQAENYLQKKGVSMFDGTPRPPQEIQPGEKREHLLNVARLRRAVSRQKGGPVLAGVNISERSLRFSSRQDVASVATRGPLTPDHVIRTKRVPLIIGDNIEKDLDGFAGEYRAYFDRHAQGALTCLDPAPRWAVWPGRGTVTFGSTVEETDIISDIVDHTLWAMEAAETLGGWKALPEKDIFDVEYWELEQAKLKKGGRPLVFQGKVALVTGAAGGIGRACVEARRARGAAVAALDINPRVGHDFSRASVLGLVCDVTDEEDIRRALETLVGRWGGLDILVSNAGIFPVGEPIAEVKPDTWQRSLDINLTGHQRLLRQCIPYLSLGIDPAVVVVASKNVSAPGPGASAYSVAKAGLTQLARVAALELAPQGVRVNVVHPNQVFDTAIWTPEVLANRAGHYGMSVEEYKTNNLLKTEIKSSDVAELVCAMAGPVFGKTTGAQVPIDGGNDRVI
jgi:rhamnose utilization protein RhaD (predicted bifunctional aldolase and dehydrogenase)/NAD(P)-dependent dehydrogenase (short-subunit alcohol dehydrogenase family)